MISWSLFLLVYLPTEADSEKRAKWIEQACAVLLCFSEKYQNSSICQQGEYNNNYNNRPMYYIHSDGSCVSGRIHSDVSSNITRKVCHIVSDNFVNLYTYLKIDSSYSTIC